MEGARGNEGDRVWLAVARGCRLCSPGQKFMEEVEQVSR